jgi:hypothetical protein
MELGLVVSTAADSPVVAFIQCRLRDHRFPEVLHSTGRRETWEAVAPGSEIPTSCITPGQAARDWTSARARNCGQAAVFRAQT